MRCDFFDLLQLNVADFHHTHTFYAEKVRAWLGQVCGDYSFTTAVLADGITFAPHVALYSASLAGTNALLGIFLGYIAARHPIMLTALSALAGRHSCC